MPPKCFEKADPQIPEEAYEAPCYPMRTKSKISGYIIRIAACALLFGYARSVVENFRSDFQFLSKRHAEKSEENGD